MKPGPRPLPDNVHALRGRPSKAAPRPALKRPPAESLDPPFPMTPRARAWWKREAPRLHRLGLLSEPDKIGLALGLESASAAVEALGSLRSDNRRNADELVTADKAHGGRTRKNPAWQIFREAQAAYLRWCAEFGWTPSARVNLVLEAAGPAPVDDDEDDDLFDEA